MAKLATKKKDGDVEKGGKAMKSKPSDKIVRKSGKSKKVDVAKKKTVKKSEGKLSWWEQALQYLREVVYELRKVVWPSRKETIASTSVVLVVVILIGVFLGFSDLILSRVMRWVIG
jgi:preprotein translocase subunit SecE